MKLDEYHVRKESEDDPMAIVKPSLIRAETMLEQAHEGPQRKSNPIVRKATYYEL